MIEGTYNINFLYNGNITGHISGQYSTPDNRHGLETITVDEYYFNGSMDNYIIEYSTDEVYNSIGYTTDDIEWLVAVASAKTDLVFEFSDYMELRNTNSIGVDIRDSLLIHHNDEITLRFKANNIIFNFGVRQGIELHHNVILILDCKTLTSYDDFISHNLLILTHRLKNINCVSLRGHIGIYNLSNLEHIGKHSFKGSNLITVSQYHLPNETVYNFEPTIIKDKYEGIQVLKQWNLIKFADNCIIEDGAFENASMNIPYFLDNTNRDIYNTIFDLCNISNESGKDVFENFGNKVVDEEKQRRTLFKIKNTLKPDFFGELYDKVYAYCEDEQFIRTHINIRHLVRPAQFCVAVNENKNETLTYSLKYTPNINTNVTLCCDVNCLEYGVGHYTAEMTDDLNINHKTLCVGYEKTKKYYRIKEE